MTEQATGMAVRTSVTVEVPQRRAFTVFTEEFETWWPRDHHIGDVPPEAEVIELREGGRMYERAPDGTECDWAKVLAYEPPERFVIGWLLDAEFEYDPELMTEVEIRFIPEGPSTTRVELEHRGLEIFGDQAAKVRDAISAPDGWGGILKRFAEVAEAA
jgi:uncharacterized protein YndB with AHSA1/START domain